MGKTKPARKPAPKRKPKAAAQPQESPTLRLEWRSPSELAQNPKNWRRHPESQLAALGDVISEVGWAGACLFNEATGRLIDGHARQKVALANGAAKVPVLVGSWSEEQERKILATLDPLAAMAEADPAALAALLEEIETESAAVQALLDSLEQENPVAVEPGGGGDEFDTTPEDGPTRTKPGELWIIGGKHRLLVGDCTDEANVARLMDGAILDLVVTDPPYGVSYADKNGFLNSIAPGNRIQEPIAGDHGKIEDIAEQLWSPAFKTLHDAMRPGASFYMFAPQGGDQMMMMMTVSAFMPVRHELIWIKNNHVLGRADYAYKHEPILYGWKDGAGHTYLGGFQTSVLEFDRPQKSDLHPTTKPVDLVAKLIENNSKPGEKVGDWFLGSGTTLIAAHRLGRTCYGLELECRYADVILRRAEAEGLTVERADG